MTVKMGIWRIDGTTLKRVAPSVVGLEQQLEDYIESDPTILGQPLLILGRQVMTVGGPLDLLAIDSTGAVHVIELKRDKTPRDVAAQVLDYGSWVASLSREEIVDLFTQRSADLEFDQAFFDAFGEAPPEELNAEQIFTIVATSLDPATQRIVRFLNESYDVPINAVFFQHFHDGQTGYLARTWLVDDDQQGTPSPKTKKTREAWNGRDWGVTFGTNNYERSWDDAVQYGFVSAGGGRWYSQTLRNLPLGARIFVNVPGAGYVGIGEVVGPAKRFDAATVTVGGEETLLSTLPLAADYRRAGDESDDMAEWVVPVQWEVTRPQTDGFWVKGMRGNQNSAFRMYQQFTIDQVTAAFGVAP